MELLSQRAGLPLVFEMLYLADMDIRRAGVADVL